MYRYRLVSNLWWETIDRELASRGVSYDTAPSTSWRWYRVHEDQFHKLPQEDGPYLPIAGEVGFGLYPDTITQDEITGEWTHISNDI